MMTSAPSAAGRDVKTILVRAAPLLRTLFLNAATLISFCLLPCYTIFLPSSKALTYIKNACRLLRRYLRHMPLDRQGVDKLL